MKMDDKTYLYNELRLRSGRLESIKNDVTYFYEIARLTDWISSEDMLCRIVSILEEEQVKEKEKIDLVRDQVFIELKNVWNDVKHKLIEDVQVYLNGQYAVYYPYVKEISNFDLIRDINGMFKDSKRYTLDDFYSKIHFVIDEVAKSPWKSIVSQYVSYNAENNYPSFIGQAHDLFVQLDRMEVGYRNLMDKRLWGGWAFLKYLRVLRDTDDPIWQLTQWAKQYKREEYQVYVSRVVDFIVDNLLTLSKKETKQSNIKAKVEHVDGNCYVSIEGMDKILIGKTLCRRSKLIDALSPFGVSKTIESVFDRMLLPKDRSNPSLSGYDEAKVLQKKKQIIKSAVKELQREGFLKGKFHVEFPDSRTVVGLF